MSILADGGAAAFLLLLIPVFFIALAIAAMVFWVWMLVDAITNKTLADTDKLVWVLVVVFLHFIGALLYFFIVRKATPTPRSGV